MIIDNSSLNDNCKTENNISSEKSSSLKAIKKNKKIVTDETK